jgi:hypothetical protein
VIRNLLRAGTLLLLPLLVAACGQGQADATVRMSQDELAANAADTVVVYKTPTCGCCSDWVDHVRAHGFTVVTHDLDDLSQIKQQLGVPAGRISCHTAVVRGYTVEGHVPADLIHKMLAEKPRFRGLAVPGMPLGSPGMEGPVKQDYDVLSFDDRGNIEVYAKR